MPFLSDNDLKELINREPSLVPACKGKDCEEADGSPGKTRDERIKAASLDLTIGDIYIPGKASGRPGAHDKPRTQFSLQQGETAIVRTAESVALPSDIGGIAFPPASLSLTGLLTTNPGHLDPGYEGPLHLTLINMGREAISLKKGGRIVRVLFYRMSGDAAEPYVASGASPITEELLEGLSHDFLDIKQRAASAASAAVTRSQLFQSYGVPLLAAVLAAAGTYFSSVIVNNEADDRIDAVASRLDRLEGRLGSLGADVNLDSVESRLELVEEKLEE